MAIMRWDPWAELDQLQRDVSELFTRRLQPPRAQRPAMDAYRAEDATVVRLDVPGFGADDIDVAVHDGVLTVSARRERDETIDEGAWIRRERAAASIERSFTLPKGVDVDQITADVRNGVLELRIPHPQERKPRRIEVSSSSAGDRIVTVGESESTESS